MPVITEYAILENGIGHIRKRKILGPVAHMDQDIITVIKHPIKVISFVVKYTCI